MSQKNAEPFETCFLAQRWNISASWPIERKWGKEGLLGAAASCWLLCDTGCGPRRPIWMWIQQGSFSRRPGSLSVKSTFACRWKPCPMHRYLAVNLLDSFQSKKLQVQDDFVNIYFYQYYQIIIFINLYPDLPPRCPGQLTQYPSPFILTINSVWLVS